MCVAKDKAMVNASKARQADARWQQEVGHGRGFLLWHR